MKVLDALITPSLSHNSNNTTYASTLRSTPHKKITNLRLTSAEPPAKIDLIQMYSMSKLKKLLNRAEKSVEPSIYALPPKKERVYLHSGPNSPRN